MFDDYMHAISTAYDSLPSTRHRPPFPPFGWQDLADDSLDRAAGIRLLLNVEETDDPEPYATATQMVAHIASGRFTVSRAFSDHPVWNVEQNVAFRIVHDVLGHYAASVANGYPADFVRGIAAKRGFAPLVAGFDWRGENEACAQHFALLGGSHQVYARQALFTECLGQTAWAIERGFDGIVQKARTMDFAIKHTNNADLRDEYDRVVILGEKP